MGFCCSKEKRLVGNIDTNEQQIFTVEQGHLTDKQRNDLVLNFQELHKEEIEAGSTDGEYYYYFVPNLKPVGDAKNQLKPDDELMQNTVNSFGPTERIWDADN